MEDDIRIEKITGFAGASFNENNDNTAKDPDPLHRLFESDRLRMFERAEDFKGKLLDKDIREPLFDFLEGKYGKIRILEEK